MVMMIVVEKKIGNKMFYGDAAEPDDVDDDYYDHDGDYLFHLIEFHMSLILITVDVEEINGMRFHGLSKKL